MQARQTKKGGKHVALIEVYTAMWKKTGHNIQNDKRWVREDGQGSTNGRQGDTGDSGYDRRENHLKTNEHADGARTRGRRPLSKDFTSVTTCERQFHRRGEQKRKEENGGTPPVECIEG